MAEGGACRRKLKLLKAEEMECIDNRRNEALNSSRGDNNHRGPGMGNLSELRTAFWLPS